MELHNRQTFEEYQLSPSGRQVLAIVEGAGQPLEPERDRRAAPRHHGLDDLAARQPREARPDTAASHTLTIVASSSIDITPAAQAIVDELLPSTARPGT